MKQFLESNVAFDEGGTSYVYRVKSHLPNPKYLCLKVLKNYIRKKADSDDDDDDESGNEEKSDKKEEEPEINMELARSILKEYEILNNLNHPNIIKIYGFYFGDMKYGPAILLEYCSKNLLKAIKKMNKIDLISVIFQICSVMKYIHEKGIIHRDIKMQNILINLKCQVKICDFGIAKILDSTQESSSTSFKGTRQFMAPEFFQPRIFITNKVDVYAFGVVMFFILTNGCMPQYTGLLSYKGLQFPNSINKLSRTIIESCLSQQPEERPSFHDICKIITDNHFKLIDGIDDDIANYEILF